MPSSAGSTAAATSLRAASVATTAAVPAPPAVPAPAALPGLYVDCVSGDDAADGSPGRPWRTLVALESRTLDAGTQVFLRRGCSWAEGLALTASATATAPVAVSAYGSGPAPVLRGDGVARTRGVIVVRSPHISLSGLHVTGAAGPGVELTAPDVALSGLEIDRAAFGVTIRAPRALITGVSVHDLRMFINTPGGDDDTGAVGFDVEADDVTISKSSCTTCRAASDDYGYDGGFAEVYNHGDRLALVDNTATSAQGFLEIGGQVSGGSARDLRIQGNVATDVHGGIWIHTGDAFSIAVSNVQVSGNRIENATSDVVLGGAMAALVLRDNVISTPGHVTWSGAPGVHTGNQYRVSSASAVGFSLGSGETVSPR